jgi:hypothetical protein
MEHWPENILIQIFTKDKSVWKAAVKVFGRVTLNPVVQDAARKSLTPETTYVSKNSMGTFKYVITHDRCMLHCLTGPAVLTKKYDEKWYKYGELHRENGYAVQYTKGQRFWYQNGSLHRENGGPAAIFGDGNLEWRVHGVLNRPHSGPNSGPAKIYPDGKLEWYKDGLLHRPCSYSNAEYNIGGPAVMYNDGTEEFWVDGVRIA